MSVETYLVEPNGFARLHLRRYASSTNTTPCTTSPFRYHDIMVDVGTVATWYLRDRWFTDLAGPHTPGDHPMWPERCSCGYAFTDADPYQVFEDVLYAPKGEVGAAAFPLRNAPPGAMWFSATDPCHHEPRCSEHLIVVCPDGASWSIDSRATNCALPDDRVHRCWVHSGEPTRITVDKNGRTCAAGGGSIQTPGYHGFLINGSFTANG